MTVAEFLKMIGMSVEALKKWLGIVSEKAPELSGTIAEFLGKLDEPLSYENLANLVAFLPELGDVLKFKFDPREHPSSGM